MESLLLGIDVGTTSVKAALFDLKGKLEGIASADYPTHYLRPGWVEQQPEDWWVAVCAAVRQVMGSVHNARERVVGVAVSAQAPTLIPLDEDGMPLRPALIWMDRRAEAEVEQLLEQFGEEAIFRVTGNRADAFYVAPKILWYKNHEPHLLKQTRWFVQINGYINYCLTGTLSLDHVHAALLGLRDYATGEWSAELCEMCGVTPEQFPPISHSHATMGEVTRKAAELTGLKPGTPVMVGTVDGAAAALEAGVTEAGVAAEMTGTSTVVLLPNTQGITEPSLIAMPHALPSMHLLLGAMVATGASLNWYRDQFGMVEQSASALLNVDPFDLLTQQAAAISPGSNGVIFLPYMMGERSPMWHTNARGVLFGLSLSTPRGAVIRAIMEGAAFALRHNLHVARQAGVHAREIRSVGGGTRSVLWNQIKADVLGLPVLLPRASIGAPFGDAMLVGMGLGLYPNIHDTLRQIVQIRTVYEPNPDNHALYSEIYLVYRNLYDHLRGDFDHAAAIFASSHGG
ncbi:MAG TPA: FGGY-family carbohydrate kinase [Oceanobacillus sp.]|nr:FGGY-family carbohydrate kinase [Oceanobacillus sp.]